MHRPQFVQPCSWSPTTRMSRLDSKGWWHSAMARWSATVPERGLLRYSLRDLIRNPLRTFASVVGVALAVGLFSSTAFFVDGSASRMPERVIATVAIDMQSDLTAPLASSLKLAESLGGTSLAAGQSTTVTVVVSNTSDRP